LVIGGFAFYYVVQHTFSMVVVYLDDFYMY
jgi:hypothetical protein